MFLDIQQPPAQYLPYKGKMTKLHFNLKKVGIICRAFGSLEMGIINGCSVKQFDGCLVVVALVPEIKQIERHEEAHCSGWKH